MPHTPFLTEERLRLQAVLALADQDTTADDTLNDLVRMAAQSLGCPLSAISLLGTDRPWFKAAFGLRPRQTTRFQPFCSQTVLHNGVFVVADATLDARFAPLAAVTRRQRVRFYAGVAIRLDGPSSARCLWPTGRPVR